MGKCRKKDILSMVDAMMEVNSSISGAACRNPHRLTEMLMQCQNAALHIGTNLESIGNQYTDIVSTLEDYCENIYLMSINLFDENVFHRLSKKIKGQLISLHRNIQCEVPDDRKEVVFLPYKASMWDSLESVWKVADACKDIDVYVIPIPYYDRKWDGSFGETHYEGNLYPSYVPITHYDQYDLKTRRPDVIYIHNAYDNTNYVTSVHPRFYSENLKKITDRLIYIPYFILGEIDPQDEVAVKSMEHFCLLPGIFHADKVIVQSENMRQIYINVLTEATAGQKDAAGQRAVRKYWEEKIDGSGSPKIDKVLNTKKEELEIPEEWLRIIRTPTGTQKKIILYNTSVSALLTYGDKAIEKMRRVFQLFQKHTDHAALLWRPHPLIQATIESMRPQLWEAYRKVSEKYREDGWGIYDDTADLDRAIVLSDGYYGDPSSLVSLCRRIGMPVMIQNMDL